MLDVYWLQEVKELVKLNPCWNVWLFLCNIQGEIVFQILQNFWVAKVLMSPYILCKIFEFKACIAQRVFNTSGSYLLAGLIMLRAFNFHNWFICSSIRNWIAYANEAKLVNKDSPTLDIFLNISNVSCTTSTPKKEGILLLGFQNNSFNYKQYLKGKLHSYTSFFCLARQWFT